MLQHEDLRGKNGAFKVLCKSTVVMSLQLQWNQQTFKFFVDDIWQHSVGFYSGITLVAWIASADKLVRKCILKRSVSAFKRN
jgi:uncharacterized UPF0146 family protein